MWYNTFSHYLMKEETVTPFQRCRYEPCCFTHFVNSDDADDDQPPVRIVLMIYVDDVRSVPVGVWGGGRCAKRLSKPHLPVGCKERRPRTPPPLGKISEEK